MVSDKSEKAAALAKAWQDLQAAKPGTRIRDGAKALNTSEAALLAASAGANATRLTGDWYAFAKRLPELDYVMSLTRNDSCVLEHKGAFEQVSTFGHGGAGMATVIGSIEARFFFSAWHVAFAVDENKNDRRLTSLQVFDKAGDAIVKVYLQEGKSNYSAFHSIIKDFRAEDQGPEQQTEAFEPKEYETHIDANALLQDWFALQDTHDFHGMLGKYNVQRHHALELAHGHFTFPIMPNNSQLLLESAAATKLPIMIFVGNRGTIQIHQDIVRTIRVLERGQQESETWVNVLDPEFNLHLLQNTVTTAWVVKKPTRDGFVTSVELFDAQQELVVTFFGLRKPGELEREEWRSLVSNLPVLQKNELRSSVQ